MSIQQQKAFCVLCFNKCGSVTLVQRDFRKEYGIVPPTPQSIRRWHKQFKETGCLCKGKSTGRPRVSDEDVDRIRQSFEHSPKKSTRSASRELVIPHMTVWRVLRRTERMRYVAAYLLATLGGVKQPAEADLEKILGSVGIEAESSKMKKVISQLKDKDPATLIKEGQLKLASVPSGGGAAVAAAPAAGSAAAPAVEKVEEKKEEKKEESEESDDDMGFGLFD